MKILTRKILVESLKECPVFEHQVEIVERKGVGHPDYICDAVMEDISIALSREYLKQCGVILHHNVDKGLLVAGQVKHQFGGGKVLEPMKIIIGDRATLTIDEDDLPVEEIAIETGKNWFKKNLRFVNPEKDVSFDVELKPGSQELVDIFRRTKGLLPANDTSAAVGYAPLTETERMVLETEKFLNSSRFKEEFPESGEDVKVMGFREKEILHLTIAMPSIERFIDSEEAYFRKKSEILERIQTFVNECSELKEIKVYLNTLDEKGRGLGGVYTSVTGTSAEDADSGEVGRGNRINGLIALNRPMGTEAAAGKNPVSHVGKIYNFLTHKIANQVYQQVPGIREVYVWLCSQIGVAIDQPKICSAQLILEPGVALDSVTGKVKEVIDYELANIAQLTQELAQGKHPVC